MNPATSRLTAPRIAACVLAITAFYTFGFMSWYSSTALGLAPVLDGKETLQLAQAMADGTLPAEPFYRAPLYPGLLSLLLKIGVSGEYLPLAARFLNALCHLTTTVLAMTMAWRLWRSKGALIIGGLLVGLNPVLLHFAADPLDISLGILWLMLGSWQALLSVESKRWQSAALAGFFFGLGIATRPHLLVVALALPVALFFVRRQLATAAALPVAAVLMVFGYINQYRSGVFAPLPTQGAYNLWAANKPEANGRYFVQTVDVSSVGTGENPARLESEILYRRETDESDTPVHEQQALWRQKTTSHLFAQPIQWLGLMTRKAYYLLNDFEQYNNKTYAYHKALSPWLKWNPLGWSILLAIGALGALLGLKRPGVRVLLVLLTAYAAGVLLFYASARFRLPMVPLLGVLSGGAVCLFNRQRTGLGRCPAIIIALALFAFSLTPFYAAWDTNTYAQDELLIAQANMDVQQDAAARQYAINSLKRNPHLQAAREVALLSQFNLWLDGSIPPPDRRAIEAELAMINETYQIPKLIWLKAFYRWKLGEDETPERVWQQQAASLLRNPGDTTGQDALAMLMLYDMPIPAEVLRAKPVNKTPLLKIVMARRAGEDIPLPFLERRIPE